MKKYLFIFLSLFSASVLKAQNIVHGKVIDNDSGNPLYGATVTISGTNLQTSTDSAGNFSFRLINKDNVLLVSFLGYATESIIVNLSVTSEIVVRLKPQVRRLQEVMVSTGYQTLPQDRATGSFNQIDNKLFTRRVSPDIISRLEGVVPGLLFNRNTSNAANGLADISIRGTSTLFAANQPLIVVDGFPYEGDVNNIDPNIVENITILKDAAAASIWGVKSGNGVIVINTKHGTRDKKMTVDFNSNVTIGAKPDLYYNPNFLISNGFIDVEESLFAKGYYDSNLATPYTMVSPVVAILAKERDGSLSSADANAQIDALRNVDVRNDLTKYFYRHSIDQQYALNLSGGGAKSDYFIAGGYDNALSNQVGNKSSRVTLNSTYNFYPVKNLAVYD